MSIIDVWQGLNTTLQRCKSNFKTFCKITRQTYATYPSFSEIVGFQQWFMNHFKTDALQKTFKKTILCSCKSCYSSLRFDRFLEFSLMLFVSIKFNHLAFMLKCGNQFDIYFEISNLQPFLIFK